MSVTAVEAWERYTQGRRPRRAVNAFGATTWLNWTQYEDHGPNEAILGDVRGRRVLELGSGSGCNLAHLATLGADCVGVDLAPTQTAKARRRWGHLSNLRFHTGDAVDFLAGTGERFDVVYSIFGATWFVDPDVLLPLVWRRLTPGGVLAFSHLPPADAPHVGRAPCRAMTTSRMSGPSCWTVTGSSRSVTRSSTRPGARRRGRCSSTRGGRTPSDP